MQVTSFEFRINVKNEGQDLAMDVQKLGDGTIPEIVKTQSTLTKPK